MSSIFTEYLRTLEPGGDPPDPETFAETWKALRSVLTSEMKKRSVWSASPSYLGIYGRPHWTHRRIGSTQTPGPHRDDALEELLAGCYSFIFIRRLRSLKAQLEVRPNVDGLIFLNVRNFLHDTQKRHDPLGFRLFGVFQSATLERIENRRLFVLDGDPRIRNETILGAAPDTDPAAAETTDLASPARLLCDELLPDLVTARGRGYPRMLERLGQRLEDLAAERRAFRFKNLIDPIKVDVRSRWGALWAQSQGERAPGYDEGDGSFQTLVRQVEPDTRLEEHERFEKVAECIDDRLEELGGDPLGQEYLERLWLFLRAWAAESEDGGPIDAARFTDLPSRRKLSELLEIPRDRLPGLYERLGELFEACRDVDSGEVRTWPPEVTQPSARPWKEKR